jgi:hypothetical protein
MKILFLILPHYESALQLMLEHAYQTSRPMLYLELFGILADALLIIY